jgi:hypothetical protein
MEKRIEYGRLLGLPLHIWEPKISGLVGKSLGSFRCLAPKTLNRIGIPCISIQASIFRRIANDIILKGVNQSRMWMINGKILPFLWTLSFVGLSFPVLPTKGLNSVIPFIKKILN